jgi:hypothetical protein
MAQVLTVASILALVGFGWFFRERFFKSLGRAAGSAGHAPASEPDQVQRAIYKASAQDFLRGSADLTFGFVILGLGFFMLMWVIATG